MAATYDIPFHRTPLRQQRAILPIVMGENAAAAAGRRTTGQKTGFATTSTLTIKALNLPPSADFPRKSEMEGNDNKDGDGQRCNATTDRVRHTEKGMARC